MSSGDDSLLTGDEMYFIGLFLQGFFYGLYSGILAIYLQYHVSKKDTNLKPKQTIIYYSMCSLYVLSVGVFLCNITIPAYKLFGNPPVAVSIHIVIIPAILFACCELIAQFILIYRCWIVWGHNIHVVIIPSVLAFAFLGTWLAGGTSVYILSDISSTPHWGYWVTLSSLALSLTVNSLVMGLIVFRIFRVFQGVEVTSDDQNLGAAGGSKLRRVIMIMIESGMALFLIQLARLVDAIVWTEAASKAFNIITPIHQMLTGITPTIIVVRTAMGLSFDDEKSIEEVAIGSLRFASNHQNSVAETGSISSVGQDSRDNDIANEQSNDIEHECK